MKSNARAQNQAHLNGQAITLFQAGQLPEAEAICNKILRNTPQQSDTLNILAAIRAAQGKLDEAVKLLARAVAYVPGFLDGYLNRSNYLQQLGRYAEALEDCNRALAIKPDAVPVLLSKGSACLALQDYTAALEIFAQAQQYAPNQPMVLFRSGDAYFHLGQHGKALACYDQALLQLPDSIELLHNRAMVLKAMGRFEDALVTCQAALTTAPQSAPLHYMLGTLLQRLRQPEAALDSYQRALECDAGHLDSLNGKSAVLQELGDYDTALTIVETVLAQCPDSADVYNNYGNCLNALGRETEAFAAYETALRLAPTSYPIHNNHSNALFKRGQYAEAVAGYDAAIRSAPHLPDAYCGKGSVLYALGEYMQAGIAFKGALEADPNSALAQFNRGVYRLLLGDFQEGWPLYEARWYKPGQRDRRDFPQPLWIKQQDLKGKTILLHAEQGLGDTLQFCRYLPMVEALGAHVVLEVQPPLVTLMRVLPGNHTVIARGEPLPAFDFHCPLMSLPLAFGTRLETVPSMPSYLRVPTEKAEEWAARLGAPSQLRVGLAWSGSTKHQSDAQRSMPLKTLAPLWALDAEFHAIQNEVRAGDEATLADSPIHFHGAALQDMSDAAALIAAMDVVISVDTSLVHLAGALGVPTQVMLPFAPDFRWLLNRTDSPWYPSLELVRQTAIGAWEPVVAQLTSQLQQHIQTGARSAR